MRLLGNKKYRSAFKGVISLAYVILLGSQLSHKFYLCANSPTDPLKHSHSRVEHTQRSAAGSYSLLAHKNAASLSLDKRYENEHLIALVDPLFYFPSHFLPRKQGFSPRYRRFIQTCFHVNPLRGPPSV